MSGDVDGGPAVRIDLGDGVEVVAWCSGTVSGPTAVLVHGIGMTHLTFADLQPVLAASLPVVAVDLPGFGAARRPPRPFLIEDHAAALDAALTRLGVTERVLVGHSMGVQVVVATALLRPAHSVVLVGPVVDPARRTLGGQARVLALDASREPPGVNARMLVDYARGGIPWYLANLRAMFAFRTEERIAGVSCPVAVVRGAGDPIAPEPWCRQVAGAAGGPAELVTVPDSAHVVPITGPEALAAVVLRLATAERDDPVPRSSR